MRTDALRFGLDARLADGEIIVEAGVRCAAPLTVPEEGVQSWELCGGQTLALCDGVVLPSEFTVAVWCKLLPLASRQPGSLLSGGHGAGWLAIGEDSLRLGTTEGLAAAAGATHYVPLPSLATSWHLLVMCGTKGGSSTLAFAGAGDARPQVLCAAPWAPDALVLVGDPAADLGHVSSVQVWRRPRVQPCVTSLQLCVSARSLAYPALPLQMWSRRLEIAELRSLWVSGCAMHSLPPPPEWVDWRAAPAAGTTRVIGTATDALTGAALECVRVCAVKRGDCHPLSGAHRAVGESGGDGAFGIEVPAEEADEEGVLVLTLTLAGYAPQTLSVSMRGGETAVVPRARLLRLGAHTTVAAAEGGTMVDLATGATFTIPRAAFLNPDGTAFVGTAAVCAAAIDPSDPGSLAAMPGDFRATTLGGAPVMLRSFGAFYFSAADEVGGVLTIDEACGGVLVEWQSSVAMDIAGKCAELPSVWRFDDAACRWVQLPSPLEVQGTPLQSYVPEAAAPCVRSRNPWLTLCVGGCNSAYLRLQPCASPRKVEGTPLPSPGTKAFDEALDTPDAPPVEAANTKGRAAGKKSKGGVAKTVEQKAAAAVRSAAAVASFLNLFAKPKGIKLRMALKARTHMCTSTCTRTRTRTCTCTYTCTCTCTCTCTPCAHQASATCIRRTMAILSRPAARGSIATLPTSPACYEAGCAAGRRGRPRG